MTWGLRLDWGADTDEEGSRDYWLDATQAEVELLAEEINAVDNDVEATPFAPMPLSIEDFRWAGKWAFEPRDEEEWTPAAGE